VIEVEVQKYFKSEKDKNNKFEENEDYFYTILKDLMRNNINQATDNIH
jgi:hypothetical protein